MTKPEFHLSFNNKKCSKCKCIKDISYFGNHKTTKDKFNAWCRPCIKSAGNTVRKRNSSTILGHLKVLFSGTRRRCIRKNKEFDITLDDLFEIFLKQNGSCALTKVKMTWEQGIGISNTHLSIDRIDSSQGYIKTNIQLVCYIVNVMKNKLTTKELLEWCNLIIKNN